MNTPNTDKQPQTVGHWVKVSERPIPENYSSPFRTKFHHGEGYLIWESYCFDDDTLEWLEEIPNVYIHTPEELEELIREKQREAVQNNPKPTDLIDWINKEGLPQSKYILRELNLLALAKKFGYDSIEDAINGLDNPYPKTKTP